MNLTQQERMVLIVLAVVLWAGSLLHFLFKKMPHVDAAVSFIERVREE